MIDTLVVGAGPAGVAAAIELRRAGRDVAARRQGRVPPRQVLRRRADHARPARARAPRLRPGDGARLPGRRRRRAALPVGTHVQGPAPGRRRDLRRRRSTAAARRRARRPRRRGRRRRPPRPRRRVGSPSTTATAVVGVEGLGDVAARHVVAADGMWSPTRKALGLGADGYLGEWHAFRQYVGGVTGAGRRRADRLVRRRPAARLRLVVPAARTAGPTSASGCCATAAAPARTSSDLWAGLLERPHIAAALGPQATPEGRHLAWPIPARIDRAAARPRAGAVHRRCRGGDRRDDRRRHRPGAAHRPPRRRGDRRRRYAPTRSPSATAGTCAPSSSPTTGCRCCSVACCGIARGADGALAIVAHSGTLGPAQLRPLDVRGRAAGDRRDPEALASPLPRPPRRLRAEGLRQLDDRL